ncbi:acyltransferase [Nocardioides jejuensis]|uniref:Acyltransferase n=1 Tax=Nocardioides jejuensis TaxID=2502782 RepID=A0A4R1CFS3_9ACTN|nr:hypothetical protein [Nocardioides jejuensis]TCJ30164.1 hypothetical protein EPD65_04565 [Nocardioides jejuensis]
MRHILTTLVFLLPFKGLKVRLLRLLGHDIHPTASIGINFVQRVEHFSLAEGARIGHFNVFRFMKRVEMGRGSRMALFNWVLGGAGFEGNLEENPHLRTLRMGEGSVVISFHYLDCGGGVLMEDNSWLTGIRSTVLSHAFDPKDGGVILEPVILEKRSAAATNCTLLPGAVLGEGALLAAGSTLWTRQKAAAQCLHGGVPARRLAPIDMPDSLYNRTERLG